MSKKNKRTPHASEEQLLSGLVVASLGKACEVEYEGEVMMCRPRGRLYLEDHVTRPVTGDRVAFSLEKGQGWIHRIEPRHHVLQRRAPETGKVQILAANMDQILICMAAQDPPFRPGMVDRYLILCEASGIEPLLILNKSELLSPEELQTTLDPFRALGYRCLPISVYAKQGLEELRAELENKNSVLTGPSGVGKSSIVNFFEPALQLRTGEISAYTRKGKHTTTVSRLFPFLGGTLMDTPGIRELGLISVTAEELPRCFREMQPYLEMCRFRNCQHDAEPHCAVKEAVEAGEIQRRRYESYLQLRAEIIEETDPYASSS
ncbi:MAG: ribosome small subunit-dependent GTPase A [Myxococcales bacterium]|nr:ribosome small subunit-dependent GTPase A [Myxococcales bacterium]